MHEKDKHRYDDMLKLPHHISIRRPQMPVADRAAQFSSFAALTSYEAAIEETARLTDARIELDEDEKACLNEKLQMLLEVLDQQPEVKTTYFHPDGQKAGGVYVRAAGRQQRIDETARTLVLTDRSPILNEQIYTIESALFCKMDWM